MPPDTSTGHSLRIEKMARAARESQGWAVPWDSLPQWYKDRTIEELTAALAAWEAHLETTKAPAD